MAAAAVAPSDVGHGAARRWGSAEASHPRRTMPRARAVTTRAVSTRDSPERSARVPLVRPAKASPTTGSTGAPHPITLHGPVESPRTPAAAPRAPPPLQAEARHLGGRVWSWRYSQSEK